MVPVCEYDTPPVARITASARKGSVVVVIKNDSSFLSTLLTLHEEIS